jgi:uncharacterized protein YpmB
MKEETRTYYIVLGTDMKPSDMSVLMGATSKQQAIKLWRAWNDGVPFNDTHFRVRKMKITMKMRGV